MLLALISSTFLFMVLYYVGEEWLDYYFNSSSYMVNMHKKEWYHNKRIQETESVDSKK